MADPEIWKALIESGNPYAQQERQQRGLMGMMELEEKRRAMADEQRLRELYAGGREPSQREVMAANPKLGIELQKAGNQAYLQQLQAEELMRKKNEADAKTYAQYVGPVADTYYDDLSRGMPEEQAMQKFRSGIGAAQSELHQKHGIMPQADFTQFNPEHILQRTTGLGVPSRHYTQQEEMQKEAMRTEYGIQQKQAPSASDRYFIGPDGLPHPNPLFNQGGGMPSRSGGGMPTGGSNPYAGEAPYKFTTPGGQSLKVWDLGSAAQALQELPEGPERDSAAKWLDEKWSEMRNPQKIKTKQELEVEAAGAKKKAELDVQAEHEAEQQLTTMKALDAQNVESLIDKSFHSKPEALAKGEYGLSGMAGKSTEANTAYKDLVVIEAQMRDMAKAIVGSGPISEGEQKIIKDALGGVSTPGDAESRKSAYRKFVEMAKAKIAKYPHLAQQMKAIEQTSGKAGSAATPEIKSLKIGDIDEGMEYLGGDPHSESSWKKVK